MDTEAKPGSKWNQAAFIFSRIHALKVGAHSSRFDKDLGGYYPSLEGLFIEVYPRMNDTEKKKHLKTLRALRDNLNKIKLGEENNAIVDPALIDNFVDFELALAEVMEREKMNMPDQLDDFDD